jgi:hypothetical protein
MQTPANNPCSVDRLTQSSQSENPFGGFPLNTHCVHIGFSLFPVKSNSCSSISHILSSYLPDSFRHLNLHRFLYRLLVIRQPNEQEESHDHYQPVNHQCVDYLRDSRLFVFFFFFVSMIAINILKILAPKYPAQIPRMNKHQNVIGLSIMLTSTYCSVILRKYQPNHQNVLYL